MQVNASYFTVPSRATNSSAVVNPKFVKGKAEADLQFKKAMRQIAINNALEKGDAETARYLSGDSNIFPPPPDMGTIAVEQQTIQRKENYENSHGITPAKATDKLYDALIAKHPHLPLQEVNRILKGLSKHEKLRMLTEMNKAPYVAPVAEAVDVAREEGYRMLNIGVIDENDFEERQKNKAVRRKEAQIRQRELDFLMPRARRHPIFNLNIGQQQPIEAEAIDIDDQIAREIAESKSDDDDLEQKYESDLSDADEEIEVTPSKEYALLKRLTEDKINRMNKKTAAKNARELGYTIPADATNSILKAFLRKQLAALPTKLQKYTIEHKTPERAQARPQLGHGIDSSKIPFGKFIIDKAKLKRNIFSIKWATSGQKVIGFNNKPISDNLKKVLTAKQLHSKVPLDDEERDWLHKLYLKADVEIKPSKKAVIGTGAPNTYDAKYLINRFDLLTGEISSGNDNKALKNELSDVLDHMMRKNIITRDEAKDITDEFIMSV